jgi:hypothetical protein
VLGVGVGASAKALHDLFFVPATTTLPSAVSLHEGVVMMPPLGTWDLALSMVQLADALFAGGVCDSICLELWRC